MAEGNSVRILEGMILVKRVVFPDFGESTITAGGKGSMLLAKQI